MPSSSEVDLLLERQRGTKTNLFLINIIISLRAFRLDRYHGTIEQAVFCIIIPKTSRAVDSDAPTPTGPELFSGEGSSFRFKHHSRVLSFWRELGLVLCFILLCIKYSKWGFHLVPCIQSGVLWGGGILCIIKLVHSTHPLIH